MVSVVTGPKAIWAGTALDKQKQDGSERYEIVPTRTSSIQIVNSMIDK